MLLGMPTLLEANDVEDCARLCKDLGLNFVELNMNMPQYQTDKIDVNFLNSLADKYGIAYTLHLDENTNVCDFNNLVAKAYSQSVADTIDIAKKLGARIINMHLSKGVYFTLPDKKVYLYEKYLERYLTSILEFRDLCEKKIGDSIIYICIENTNGFEDFQIKALDILLQSKVFGLTFDIGHNYASGGKDEDFILNNKAKLRHFHLHDATRSADHLAFGEGEINLSKYFDLAKRIGASCVIETKTLDSLQKSCDAAKRIC